MSLLSRIQKLSLASLILSLLVVVGIQFVAINHLKSKGSNMEKFHILNSPMVINSDSDSHSYLLPKGTYLYFDGAFPEGFIRYKVYVNVDKSNGAPLPLTENTNGVEAPITAYPITKESLLNMVKTIQFDKDEIKSIISNGHFSSEDIKEINDFMQQKINK
jgi:hypothetical protein